MDKQNLYSGILSALAFLAFVFIFQWPFLVSLLLAVGIFFAFYLIFKPEKKIGNYNLEKIKNGQELLELYNQSVYTLDKIKGNIEDIEDKSIRHECRQLVSVGQDILNYLESNPIAISQSRHFLEYYFGTADKIIDNYVKLKKANISASKFNLIKERTEESIILLKQVFAQQRDSYHKDTLLDLEVESELLEKTIKLSGGELE